MSADAGWMINLTFPERFNPTPEARSGPPLIQLGNQEVLYISSSSQSLNRKCTCMHSELETHICWWCFWLFLCNVSWL